MSIDKKPSRNTIPRVDNNATAVQQQLRQLALQEIREEEVMKIIIKGNRNEQ